MSAAGVVEQEEKTQRKGGQENGTRKEGRHGEDEDEKIKELNKDIGRS